MAETASSAAELAREGLECFKAEQYQEAEDRYRQALDLEPDNKTYREMLDLSHRNVVARADLVIPPAAFFDEQTLLRGPSPGHLPGHDPIRTHPGPFRAFFLAIGTGLGAISTVATNLLTAVIGRILGYKGRVWTDWYDGRPTTVGVLTLAYMRDQLNKNNLKNVYPDGWLIGFQNPDQKPPPGVEHFRSADGSWNNLQNPMEGAAGTRFPRFIELSKAVPETGEKLMTPNPREISRHLLARGEKMKEVPFLNMFAAAWIQFMNDDWINHGEHLRNEHHVIPFAEDDPARAKFQQDCLKVGKTQPDPTYGVANEDVPVTFINEVTAWWDGSQLYGSDIETQRFLRTNSDGKMRLNHDGTLPRDPDTGMEQAGMTRNWWVGLSMLHSVFLQEHNAICDMLKHNHPDWSDDVLFNIARLINAAVMAKIHTVEWTPAILPNPGLTMGLNANWYGILTYALRSDKQRKTLSEIKIRNPELGGVVGNPIDKHNCPYSLAEEFVEVYRLHSLLPETLQVRCANSDGTEDIPFVETRQIGAAKIVEERPMADLLYSFGRQQPGQLVLNNYPHFLRELSIPGNPVYDMAAVDILRARERGVPRYNEFRRLLGLGPISSFEDLFPPAKNPPSEQDEQNARWLADLKRLYDDDVELLDLLVGTLSEGVRPTGFGFGETMFQIFILAASRRLQADRFYTDCYDEAHYTQEGLDWIDKADLKAVLLRHYPELEHTGLGNITNAFEPWDNDRELCLDRHPLRQWDADLKTNPSLGNRFR